jgi:hypothetical protein
MAGTRRGVFVCYSHSDKESQKRLKVFLKAMERRGLVQWWSDDRIEPGQPWREEIRKAIDSAAVAILLLSEDFLASDFIYDFELPTILHAEKSRGLVVLPVILKPCTIETYPPLERLQAVNDPSEPLIDMKTGDQERLWRKVSLAVAKVVAPQEDTRELAPGDRSTGSASLPGRNRPSTTSEDVLESLHRPDPPPALALDGRWKSEYTWMQNGKLIRADWPEEVVLQVTGQHVTGLTTQSKFPFRLEARIQDSDILGQTISLHKSFKLNGVFILRLNVDTEKEMNGHWVGTGTQLFAGEWTLTKLPD